MNANKDVATGLLANIIGCFDDAFGVFVKVFVGTVHHKSYPGEQDGGAFVGTWGGMWLEAIAGKCALFFHTSGMGNYVLRGYGNHWVVA